jgi:murein L,D-transpeptidase YcbB/YkuD
MSDNGLKKEIHYPTEYSKAVEAESQDSISWYELMITAQYLHFAEKVITGLPNKIIAESEWYIPRKKVGYATMLENMLTDSSATLNKFVYYQYQLLREQLKRLKVMENKGGWPIPENINKPLILGDTGKQIKMLKLRLYHEEYAINDTAESLFDKNLEDAVKLYQKNNGLHADGVVGKGTIKMMQFTIKERIERILERQQPLTKPMIVWRGQINATINNTSWFSTSTHIHVALNYGGNADPSKLVNYFETGDLSEAEVAPTDAYD